MSYKYEDYEIESVAPNRRKTPNWQVCQEYIEHNETQSGYPKQVQEVAKKVESARLGAWEALLLFLVMLLFALGLGFGFNLLVNGLAAKSQLMAIAGITLSVGAVMGLAGILRANTEIMSEMLARDKNNLRKDHEWYQLHDLVKDKTY